MKYFVILSFFVILFSIIPQSDALIVSYTPEELYEIYDIIVFGAILDYVDVGTNSHYDVKVIQSLKNAQPDDVAITSSSLKF